MAPGLDQTVLVVGRIDEGLDFAALDSQPVDLVFLLLSPSGAIAEHLRVLARLARIITAKETLAMLRSADGPEELFDLLIAEDARHVY
jgi:PTS system nitrogen regulatory IIA component